MSAHKSPAPINSMRFGSLMRSSCARLRDPDGECEVECRTLVLQRFDPNLSAISLNDALTYGETDAGAGDCFAVQSLKHAENLFVVFGSDPDPVVFDRDAPQQILPFSGDM